MKRYMLLCVSLLMALASSAQTGAPANVEAVDLGLPSGTRWASCNVGATKPEEFGGYYAWGETETKEVYEWSTYSHCDGNGETCRGLDGNICGTQYDVAHVKWGDDWRMPTFNEIEELVDNCTKTVTELNSVQVMKLTGPNGNSIYLPFTGYMKGTDRKNIGYDSGYFWSGVNPYADHLAPCMVLSASSYASYDNLWDKYLGLAVRPVTNVLPSVPRTYIDLGLPSGTKWANMNVGASRPEDYGEYFAWGETSAKGSYSWDNYMCPEATCGKPGDPVYDLVGDKADIAGTKFDAATINWGASWNMPTAEQVEELASNCYSSLVTINGVACRKLKSRINGNEIIFPLAGARWFENFFYEGSLGYYWASTLRQGGYVSPCRLIVRDDTHGWGWSMGGENDRFSGFPIRPVYMESNTLNDTISYHKFSIAFEDGGSSEVFGSGIKFQRAGNADSYLLSIDNQQSSDSSFDISKVASITRKSIGQMSLPKESDLNVNDLTITVDGDTISTDEKGAYDAIGSTLIATNSNGEIVYMNIAAVEDANNAAGADLNAKESAITLMLPMVPNIFVAFDDEHLPHLKEMIWDVAEVKQLAAAIDRSVAKYGYTDFGEISKEATAARNKISQLLHLDKLAKKLDGSASSASRKSMLKASGSTESPYIVNPYGFAGLQVVITDSKQKKFYHPHIITGYNCDVTAYNYNRFAYSSVVKGKYDGETGKYYIPDLGSDYDYYKNILKPQKVSTFMNTFTSFKYEDLERLGEFFGETVDLLQGDIWFDEMHWSDEKKTVNFDISDQGDAVVLLFPRGNDYMMVYNVMQSIMKPIVKIISKKAAKMFDSDIFFPIICEKMINDPNYILEVKSAMFDSNLNAAEKVEKITSATWNQFFKVANKLAWDKIDDALKDALTDFVDESVMQAGSIQAASDWVLFKVHFKVLGWIKKYGDLLTGVLGTFYEDNAFYPIHWDANGQFVLERDEVTLGEGESANVRILVGDGPFRVESSEEEIATVTSACDKVKIHGVDAGDAVITVRDEVAQKTEKINVHVTGIQTFVLAESTVSVPVYQDKSVTIERGNGPFHVFGGDEKIAVAKLVSKLFPGEKNKVVISGVSKGNTIFYVYDEATHQTLSLMVKVTADEVVFTDERIVDLGLSVNWANCNVGANEPQEYGDYFAWGELEPKESYSPNNYKYYSNGNFVDIGSNISGTEYDAATHNMGNDWRMPTKAELEELISKCEWKFVTYRRIRGWKVTGPNGNSIFLPATGYMLYDWNENISIDGFYWSSNMTDNNREVYTLFTTMHDYKMFNSHMNRYEGRTIRPVMNENDVPGGEPYVVYNDGVLSFYCDGKRDSRSGETFNLPNEDEKPAWDKDEIRYRAKKVFIDSSFAKARPKCTMAWFYNSTEIVGLQYLNTSNVSNMSYMFNYVKAESLDLRGFSTEKVTNMSHMFECCFELTTINLSSFNTENVTNMSNMFNSCHKLATLDLGIFNTGKVTDMSEMFFRCEQLVTLNLSSFNTRNVKDMSGMFQWCWNLSYIDLSGFNTENVTNMNGMFDQCNHLESLDLSGFKTEKVTKMSGMFSECTRIKTLDLSTFNTENVTTMSGMFDFCSSLTSLEISSFNTENVTDMSHMFYACGRLTSLNLRHFNTGKVTDMSYMFGACYKLTSLDVSSFNTKNVTNMSLMFCNCESLLTLNLSNFNTEKVTQMAYMFEHCCSLISLDLSSFNTQKVTQMHYMFCGCSKLLSLDLSNFSTENVISMDHMFGGDANGSCSSLSSLDLSSFNTKNVTDMSSMFDGCSSLTSLNLRSFNTENVTNMSNMFHGCSSLISLDLSSFNTKTVTDMSNMFWIYDSQLKTIYVSNSWSMNNVDNSEMMFMYCFNLVGGKGTVYDENHIDGDYARIDGGPEKPGYFTDINTLNLSSGAYDVRFDSNRIDSSDDDSRYFGQSVRPVRANNK